jgi:hypothetical protein
MAAIDGSLNYRFGDLFEGKELVIGFTKCEARKEDDDRDEKEDQQHFDSRAI